MKNLFLGYYSPSNEEFSELWQKGTFILDTNVFLNFYEYNNELRKDLFDALEFLKTRLWIPHQVVLEYHENRVKRIKQAKSKVDEAKQVLERVKSDFDTNVTGVSGSEKIKGFDKTFLPLEIIEELKNNVAGAFKTFSEELELFGNELIEKDGPDYIRDKITDLFEGKIGEPFTQDELNEIYSEGEQRYKYFRPPGFGDKDEKKGKVYNYNKLLFKREYGDLILWKQILRKVETKEFSHIIFITDDRKEDWWLKDNKKIIGPHPELVREILDSGASMFHIYRPAQFLTYAKKYIKLEVKEESIQQVEQISTSKYVDGLIREVQRNLVWDKWEKLDLDRYRETNLTGLKARVEPSSQVRTLLDSLEDIKEPRNSLLDSLEDIE